LKAPVFTFTDA